MDQSFWYFLLYFILRQPKKEKGKLSSVIYVLGNKEEITETI